ncbi:hypothetical protein ABIE78_006417 [Sinorhizobium fredii]|jgi:hypothetical protein|uniref:Secreted protein n=1 Tax=Sinorhizobium fredii (strain USDA 257) TaxID=1185652 RepID=I3XDK3_SINF2|nr:MULTISPECIES: hypothetical protein [Sinorhizobium]AFL53959.1 hypothetical protein USDA257_c54370 [Sinorhizobium fredii USDA 257]PDT80006.1 hypothetical protein CO676_30130 [Sinorhizobium sp. BJ1]
MRCLSLTRIIPAAMVAAIAAWPVMGAQGDDPDWPCIQRKVAELSLGQFWTGAELPQTSAGWSKDAAISALVTELSARRVPLPEAQRKIREYAESLPEGDRQRRMTMLVQGLFDHMNRERSQVIAGIARYAHRQRDMAAFLRQEASAVDALQAKPGADPNELQQRNDRLVFQTRVFQERAQSLSFVCEVPTLIERRLYALVKSIAEALEDR